MSAPFGLPVHRFSVPTRFLEDHVSRDLDRDEDGNVFLWIVKRGKRVSTIEATIGGIAELRSDAAFYADLDLDDDDRSLIRSARSTVASIDRQMLSGKTR